MLRFLPSFQLVQSIDRIQLNSLLVVLCFVAVLTLTSQSAASYPTYALALAMLINVRHWNDVLTVRLWWLVFAVIFYLSCSSLWSEPFAWRSVGSAFVRGMLILSFVIALAECQLRGQVQRWLARAMAVAGGIVAFAALVAFFVTQPADGRLNGLGQLDTHVVAALVYGVVVIFNLQILCTERSVAWRIFAGLSVAITAWAVVLSDSRNAWISVILGASVYLLSRRVADRQRFALGCVVVAFLMSVMIGGLLSDEAVRDYVIPRGDSFRMEIWGMALKSTLAAGPIFGAGVATPDDIQVGNHLMFHAHNLYISVLYQGGIVGLVMFIMLLFGVLKVLYTHYQAEDAKLALGILAVALPSYLLDGHELLDKVGETWFLLWLPIAISLGLRWSRPVR